MSATAPTAEGLMTAEEFLAHPSAEGSELINGQMKERPRSKRSAWIGGEIYARLREFAREHGGYAFPDGADFRCFGDEKTNVRKPDASYLRPGRLDVLNEDGAIEVLPDVAVEVLSPNDRVFDVDEKLETYRKAQIPVVVVISPHKRTATLYRGEETETVRENEAVDLSNQMPGFSFRLADVLPA